MLQRMEFTQLWPDPGTLEIGAQVGLLGPTGRAASRLPFTVANFVSSIDGRASVQGRSGPLGDDGDKAVFRALRGQVDAVLVGTGTLEAERYGRLIRDPAAREHRLDQDLRSEPLLCIVTRSGSLPLDIPLFDEPEAEVIVFSGQEIRVSGVSAQVEVIRVDPEQLTFAAALAHLRREEGVRALLCEGGPSVFGALLREDLVDQLFLTLAPLLAGGGHAPTIANGPPLPEPAAMHLESVLERAGTLFLRYARAT
jgi:riboflavin biosynthesis pyrimidine reductase